MLKRKITRQLLDWKKEQNKPCLLVKGARQVGKTYIVEHFARENYANYIYINFELFPEYRKIFDGNLDFTTLRMNLETTFPNQKIEKGKTLLFLDEIQACPNARVALKTFALDGTVDVVASESLLGLYYKEVSSYPVGYERPIELFPLDFEEFLWGLGVSEEVIVELKAGFETHKPLSEVVVTRISEYFRHYLLVGGMPSVVNQYLETRSPQKILKIQRAIIENYKNDILKYASKPSKQKIIKTFESIPMQLARRNKKFVFSDIDKDDASPSERKYSSSLSWLRDAGIVNFCHNLQEPALPLSANRKLESYKLYMRDTGLLVAMLESRVGQAILNDELLINEGALMENVCAGELAAHGYPLTYFKRKSSLEIDFVLDIEGVVTATEVKSGLNAQAKSLQTIIERYDTVKRYVKLEPRTDTYVSKEGIEHYPLFMVMFL